MLSAEPHCQCLSNPLNKTGIISTGTIVCCCVTLNFTSFLASAVMLMTSGSLLGFGVFCSWWQCRKQVVCVGQVFRVLCQPLPCTQQLRARWYGSYLVSGSRRRYAWWFEREGDGYDLAAPECWKPHAECRPSVDCLLETGPMENNTNRQMHK